MPYKIIYGTQGKTEFFSYAREIANTKSFPNNKKTEAFECRIECKRQVKLGSVDEKYPYLYLSCIKAMPEDNIILLMSVPGAKPEALEWLKKACVTQPHTNKRKRIVVMESIESFLTWANDAFAPYKK